MAEKLRSAQHEKAQNIEQLQDIAAERRAEMQRSLEKGAERPKSENLEKARHEALELAHEAAPEPKETQIETTESKEPRQRSKPTKKQLDDNFNRSMKTIRKEMTPASRTFSKVIHTPVVEKTSEVLATTVARPNLILAGGLGTLILCSIVYLLAKNYGYVLSGFEAIGTFILGWAIGAVIEFTRVGFANKTAR